MSQLALDFDPPVSPKYAAGATISERFTTFHAANPHVARALATLARQLLNAGHKKISVKLLFERLRWEWATQTTGDQGRTLNNDFTALYGRLLAEQCPDLRDAFNFRERRAA